VKKVAGGVTSWFWYGADGALVAEDTTEAQEAGRQYLHVDALGSTRLITRSDKSVVARMDYWPFGEEVAGTSLYGNRDLVSGYASASTVKQRFTGKERDPENGFDYFGARYYAGVMGRWTSPDAPWEDQDPMDPQTWNLFMYGRNTPTRFVDPDGKSFKEFWDGMTNAANSNAGAGARVSGSAKDYKLGQRMGDALSIVGGLLEMGGGGSMIGGGAAACGTGALCAAGAPAIVGGAAAVGHGAAMTANGIANFMGASDDAPQSSGNDETLTRYGDKPETVERLAEQAAKAEAHPKVGIHGVSTTTKPNPTNPGGQAPRSTVEQQFKVHNTLGKGHRTVELPKPVTQQVVDAFNKLFGFGSK
jgi:RHS repeat-associated protein